MRSFAVASLIALVCARAVLADAFLQCSDFGGGNDRSYANPPSGYGSVAACKAACLSTVAGSTIAGYRSSDGACACASEGVPAFYVRAGNAPCGSDLYQNVAIATSFTFQGCATTVTGFATSSTDGNTACLAACRFYEYAAIRSDGSTFTCGCANSLSIGSSRTCGPDAWNVYSHSFTQASQGLSRRDRQQQLTLDTLCPAGLTACSVPMGGDTSYECLDTTSELEACGGCPHGEYGVANSPVGVDCTTTGARMGEFTCEQGQCVQWSRLN